MFNLELKNYKNLIKFNMDQKIIDKVIGVTVVIVPLPHILS